MTNNYILRRLRYTFGYNDNKMIDLFKKGDLEVTREQVSTWLKKDDDPDYVRCNDKQMSHFLNGLIAEKRGKQEGKPPKVEYSLNNNIILRKFKIAFNLIDQDMIDLLDQADFKLSKSELSALFRKPDHKHYRECQDQLLRNFLQGLQMRHTNQSTAAPQSKFQVLKAQSENRKDDQAKKTKPKKTTEKRYQNPKQVNKKRDDNAMIWGSDKKKD